MSAEILEAAAAVYQEVLWTPDLGRMARSRLRHLEVDEQTVRRFGLGYAPRDLALTRQKLSDWELEDLVAAGIVVLGEDGRPALQLHSRIVFPVRDADGELLGLVGRATHSGPSWPEWITSPENERFSPDSALFGLHEAVRNIRAESRAVITGSPLGALLAHQAGEGTAVGLTRSHLGVRHLEVIGALIGTDPDGLTAREVRSGTIAARSRSPRAPLARSPATAPWR